MCGGGVSIPNKSKKPCAHHGCPVLTKDRFCPEHTRADARHYNRYERDRETYKRYGQPWKQVRAAYLSEHPLCEVCWKDGFLKPASLVHHRVKLTDGGTNDWSNLQAVCGQCHSRLHAEQGDRWG